MTSISLEDRYKYDLKFHLKYPYNFIKYNTKLNPDSVKNLVEKITIWYELRYPDYVLEDMLNGEYRKAKDYINLDDVMFTSNPIAKDLKEFFRDFFHLPYNNFIIDVDNILGYLNWQEFYNTKSFINSLPLKEKVLLNKAKYPSQISFSINDEKKIFRLTSKGRVRTLNNSSKFSLINKNGNRVKFNDVNINDLLTTLESNDFNISKEDIDSLQSIIAKYRKKWYSKYLLLELVMYKIIDRDGQGYGPYRAFLFAKEFNKNIDIPMQYGINTNFPYTREFINEYLKSGGSKDLMCCIDYFSTPSNQLKEATIEDILINIIKNYTLEETKLHQRFVNALSQQITNFDSKVDVESKRVERKLRRVRK